MTNLAKYLGKYQNPDRARTYDTAIHERLFVLFSDSPESIYLDETRCSRRVELYIGPKRQLGVFTLAVTLVNDQWFLSWTPVDDLKELKFSVPLTRQLRLLAENNKDDNLYDATIRYFLTGFVEASVNFLLEPSSEKTLLAKPKKKRVQNA
jgi:hypothetical protein